MSERKGIILAGGAGTPLHPITLGVPKQLLSSLRQADDLLEAVVELELLGADHR